jgi:hypothetical protein
MSITFDRIAPVLPVRDVKRALEEYSRLGFSAEAYEEAEAAEPEYGFLRRGGIELHLVRVPDLKNDQNTSACYLYVSDADALYHEWKAARAAGKFREPVDTPYSMREFVYWDSDGNLFRIGSERS